ncbi:MAG: LysM peptidoglycan-binding domain-containing protein [Anaerolineae bacterium]|nr:LysM peptidoglycan-binding domain-containing protein [Anaerolineae bacterium]
MKANLNRLTILPLLLVALILSVSVVQGAPPVQVGGKVHVVQWGDTVYSLARRYGTTVAAIVQANNLANPNWVYAGQRLIIPTGGPAYPPTAPGTTTYYTVQKGDTLYSIAYRYGTTVSAIVAANNIYNPSCIYAGQRLVIPTGQLTSLPPAAVTCYTVRKGDTLVSIALRHGTTVSAIALANNLANPSFIWVGQCLVIPGVVTAPLPSTRPAAVPKPIVVPPPPVPIVSPPPIMPPPIVAPPPPIVSPVPVQWVGYVLTTTTNYVALGEVLRVSVIGQKDLPVTVSTETWSTKGLTGSKPEHGEYACEFAPLGEGTFTVTPEGLGVSLDVELDGIGVTYVEFSQRPGGAPPSDKGEEPIVPSPIPPVPGPKPIRMNSPEYGMQAFLWWRPETAHRDLGLIRDAGFTWVKQSFAWREIEGSAKGSFGWERPDRIVHQVNEFGLDLIARVDHQPQWAGGGFPQNGPPDNYQDYADFLYAMASRYKGRIRAYQIWNEPNLNVAGRSEWGGRPPNPAEYTALLKVAYEAIKRADPNAMVISAGLSPTSRWDDQAMPDEEFLKGMYAAGAKPYFDVLGAHGAGYKVSPETDPAVVARDPALNNNDPSPEERKRIYCFRHVEDLRRIMVENGDGDKQIALLEFGWTSDPVHPEYAWFRVTEEEKGDYLVRAYQYAKQHWAPWIGVMSLIYVADPDWTEDAEQYWWAITYPDYPEMRWRPAYVAVKNMPK